MTTTLDFLIPKLRSLPAALPLEGAVQGYKFSELVKIALGPVS